MSDRPKLTPIKISIPMVVECDIVRACWQLMPRLGIEGGKSHPTMEWGQATSGGTEMLDV